MSINQSVRSCSSGQVWQAVTDGVHAKYRKYVTGGITYECFAQKPSAETSDPLWMIRRTAPNGPNTLIDFADDEMTFDKIADNYLTYFDAVVSTNWASIFGDGSTDYLTGGTGVLQFSSTQAFSISIWVRVSSIAAAIHYIMSVSTFSAPQPGWYLCKTAANLLEFRLIADVTNDAIAVTLGETVAANTWYHVVITKSTDISQTTNECFKIYVNGVKKTLTVTQDNMSAAVNPSYTTQPLNFFARNTAVSFPGNIDECSVYNRVLTQAEVTELYNSGTPLKATAFSDYAAACTNYWEMGENDTYPTITDRKGSVNLTMTSMISQNIVGTWPGSTV